MKLAITLIVAIASVTIGHAIAPPPQSVPQLVNYQGRVAVGNVNFNGGGQFKFALVDTNGATTYWSNDGSSSAGSEPATAVTLTVTKGLYSVLLGDTSLTNMTALPASVWTNADVRLRVWFNDGTNGSQLLTPDQRLAPNGYLPDGSVTSAKMADGSVSSAKIASGAVGSTQLASGAVTNTKIASGAVGSTQIASGAVTNTQLAANAVQSGNIAAGAVGSAQLGTGAVGSANLAAGAMSAPVVVSGTSQNAAANASYVATSASQTLFTLPPTANVGDAITITSSGAGGWSLNWMPRASFQFWQSVASSADGTKLVACVNGGQIYTSKDSGVTWTARDSNRGWSSVASSADGSKLVACVDGGFVYTSTDYGVNWTQRSLYGYLKSVTSSADGTTLAACDSLTFIYTSADYGVTWTPRDNWRSWWSVASSADGSKLVACVSGGQIFTSTDYGVSWTARDSNRNWTSVASSADGSKLVACEYGGYVYTSTDFGVTWTARDGVRNWYSAACSSDGSRLVACEYGGQIYSSTDSGSTWTARDSNRYWRSVTSSADGGRLVACVDGGQIYTNVTVSGTQGSTVSFEYLANSGWSPVAQSQIASGAVGTAQLASNLTLGGITKGTFSGNLTGNITLPATSSSTVGVITQNGSSLISTYGTGNFFAGTNAGNFIMTGTNNTGTGYQTLKNTATGGNNTANGTSALYSNSTGSYNTASGAAALFNNTSGNNNIALGFQAGQSLTTGSNNIDIGHPGVAGESNTIRIGDGTMQSDTFLTGVIHGDGSGLTNLNAGNLTGTLPALNGSALTNLNAGNLASGTLADGRLSTNVPLLGATTNSFTGSMVVGTGGGIAVSQATLVVNSKAASTTLPDHYYYSAVGQASSMGGSSAATINNYVSVYAAGDMVGTTFRATSDERIKSIIGPSDGAADLQNLLGIRVTDYSFKDKIAKGNRPQKKVIAQQVEKVYPQAVSRTTDVVPDIFQKAAIHDGWITLATNLKPRERVRLIAEKSEGIHEVLEVDADGKRFRTGFQPEGGEVFVYGREVKDFRVVDYEAIAMLNVSATQQIKKEKDTEIAALKKRITDLEAKDKEREARLVKLEQFIPAAPKSSAATAANIER